MDPDATDGNWPMRIATRRTGLARMDVELLSHNLRSVTLDGERHFA